MIVNSLAFLWFFIIVLAVYYACQSRKELQNIFLLVCSYWFYSQVDIKMTGLLVVLTVVFWLIGRFIGKAIEQEQERQASLLTTLSVVVGIGALFYFKYLNFFVGSFVAAADVIGLHISWTAVHVIVPIGLSFFTFKLMSYTLDIYHGKITHEDNILNFAN